MKKVKIVYYSGTGGTQRVTHCFEEAFKALGHEVYMLHLTAKTIVENSECDLLLLIYAVHACNAPELVYKWIDNSKTAKGVPAAVISVSGGGEVIPNTACRINCTKRLKIKGYDVIYERMLVMPSNWIVPTKEPLALLLLEALPKRVQTIVNDISKGIRRRTKPFLIDRFFSSIGELEKLGAKYFGNRIRVSDKCDGCGWCSRNCSANNITMNMSKPLFGNNCNLCLGCIYGCPNKALGPGIAGFIVIKDGYSLKELEKKLPVTEEIDILSLTEGYLWSGVRKYLLENENPL